MERGDIRKVLLTGPKEIGGLSAFVQALCSGFSELGYPVEVVATPRAMLRKIGDLRDPQVAKILSTWGGIFAPMARRHCVVAHGFPRIDAQGWLKTRAILASYRAACSSGRLVAVSHYSASILKACYGVQAAAVIHNPLGDPFYAEQGPDRRTCDFLFVGRLDKVKRVDQFLAVLARMRKESPSLRIRIVGEGPERTGLQETFGPLGLEFLGALGLEEVRAELDGAKVFFSGCETEALGITYLEALARRCKVVMPAGGGGLEIFPEGIQKNIFLAPLDLESAGTEWALSEALAAKPSPSDLSGFRSRIIAERYLQFLS